MDRAIKGIEQFRLKGPVDRWRAIRDAIHQEVCRRGYDADEGTFVQCYGLPLLDASLLMMLLVGCLPVSDPRVRGTIEAIERHLARDGFVSRNQHVGLIYSALNLSRCRTPAVERSTE